MMEGGGYFLAADTKRRLYRVEKNTEYLWALSWACSQMNWKSMYPQNTAVLQLKTSPGRNTFSCIPERITSSSLLMKLLCFHTSEYAHQTFQSTNKAVPFKWASPAFMSYELSTETVICVICGYPQNTLRSPKMSFWFSILALHRLPRLGKRKNPRLLK